MCRRGDVITHKWLPDDRCCVWCYIKYIQRTIVSPTVYILGMHFIIKRRCLLPLQMLCELWPTNQSQRRSPYILHTVQHCFCVHFRTMDIYLPDSIYIFVPIFKPDLYSFSPHKIPNASHTIYPTPVCPFYLLYSYVLKCYVSLHRQ